MPLVLASRWGLDPVVVVDDDLPDADEEGMEVTGTRLWDCAQILFDLVADPNPGNTFAVRGKRVIELGGGTGALSVGLARAGASAVTCTDLPCHLARIELTVHANDARRGRGSSGGGGATGVDTGGGAPFVVSEPAVVVQVLRWGEEEDLARVLARNRMGLNATNFGKSSQGACCDGGSAGATTNAAPQTNSSSMEHKDSVLKALYSIHSGEREGGGRGCGDEGDGSDAPDEPVATAAELTNSSSAFDVIVLSEVLYWPALDLFQEDTRGPLRRTLLGLSKPGTKVILVYKERWPERETEFLKSCEEAFEVRPIPSDLLSLPAVTLEDPGSSAVRAVAMTRLPPRDGWP